MDCWIQVFEQDDVRTVRVAGRMEQAHVPDLLNACAAAPGRVSVDLTDVVSADLVAVNALGRIRDAGAELVGVPTYIQFKLDSLAAKTRRRGV